MMRNNQMDLVDIAYHRNGVAGEGFHALLFRWKEPGSPIRTMLANVFDGAGQCAIVDVNAAARGEISFGVNSWCCEDFERQLRRWIAADAETGGVIYRKLVRKHSMGEPIGLTLTLRLDGRYRWRADRHGCGRTARDWPSGITIPEAQTALETFCKERKLLLSL